MAASSSRPRSTQFKQTAHLHAADDHAGNNLTSVPDNHVLSCVHVQGGHARSAGDHAQLGQALHACTSFDQILWLGQNTHRHSCLANGAQLELIGPLAEPLETLPQFQKKRVAVGAHAQLGQRLHVCTMLVKS